MRLLFSLFLIMFLLMPGAVLGAVVLDVTVSGDDQGRPDAAVVTAGTVMNKEISAAVLARLRIYQQQKDPMLGVGEMRRLHREAEKDIKSALEPLGYYSPTVEGALIEAEGVWHATYIVTPGQPVLVRSVSVEITGPGSGLSLFADLEKQFPLQDGAVLNHQQYEDGKKKILRWAIRNGFVEAGFEKNEVRVHRGNYQADIDLLLNTGHRFLFGKTSSAQQIINQDLLSRYLPYKEGDPYSLRELSQLQSILYETGFFSGVTVEPEFDKVSELRVPVDLTLAPALPNRYSFGLGYGTDTGIRGKTEWRNRLFNDSGHRVSSSLQLSEKINKVGAAYEIPVADPRYDALKYAGNWASEEWNNTKIDLLSVAAAVSHSGPVYQYGVTLEARDERYDVGVTSGSSLLLLPGGSWSVVFADNRIKTQDGWRFSVDVKGADKNIVSDATFVQAQAGVKGITSLFDKWRLIGRFTLGTTVVDSIDELPPSLRFYAGGDQSVRGYAYKSIGPTDTSGTVIGGRYLMVGSMEVERKIDDMWSVAAFYDTGQAMDSIDVNLKKSVGIGGRLTLPFGQVRLDIAMPLLEEENSFRLHLNIGADL
ncbi:MAG: autotransporter assembly complex family protein [Desulfocapsaceae bacterium]|nr:autotransporter assembly complex family protein [Desulfocapsaceae bacterium]